MASTSPLASSLALSLSNHNTPSRLRCLKADRESNMHVQLSGRETSPEGAGTVLKKAKDRQGGPRLCPLPVVGPGQAAALSEPRQKPPCARVAREVQGQRRA